MEHEYEAEKVEAAAWAAEKEANDKSQAGLSLVDSKYPAISGTLQGKLINTEVMISRIINLSTEDLLDKKELHKELTAVARYVQESILETEKALKQ